MRGTIVLSVLASSVVSAAVTALIMLAMLPSAVDAQVAKLTGSSLTVESPNGRPGVTAEVGPPGGGILQVFGSDGKTVRLSLNSSGKPGNAGIAPNAGLNVYNVDGLEVVRVGSNQALNGYAFSLRDTQGNTRYRAAVDGNGDATIQLFDAEGNVIWSALGGTGLAQGQLHSPAAAAQRRGGASVGVQLFATGVRGKCEKTSPLKNSVDC